MNAVGEIHHELLARATHEAWGMPQCLVPKLGRYHPHLTHTNHLVTLRALLKHSAVWQWEVGFEVLMVESTKMAVFWVVVPCSLVEVYQRFRGPCCLSHQGDLMMEASRTPETLVNFYQTTRQYNPEDSHLRTHRRENLKSYKFLSVPLLSLFETRSPELNY
jgi:hypothetical protein